MIFKRRLGSVMWDGATLFYGLGTAHLMCGSGCLYKTGIHQRPRRAEVTPTGTGGALKQT